MRDKIYCLMTSSVSLDFRMTDVLFDTACLMLRGDSRRKIIKDAVIEGVVTTSFDQQALGSVTGTEFYAEVETELGKGKVKFIVRDADVKTRNKLKWIPFFSIEDMLEEVYSPPSRQTSMFN